MFVTVATGTSRQQSPLWNSHRFNIYVGMLDRQVERVSFGDLRQSSTVRDLSTVREGGCTNGFCDDVIFRVSARCFFFSFSLSTNCFIFLDET